MTRGERGLGREIILALVVEEPGTAWDLETRLGERLPAYGYDGAAVRRTLGRLAEAGLVVERQGARPRRRHARVWEATEAGVERWRQWIAEGAYAFSRDQLHARISVCPETELPCLLKGLGLHRTECERHLGALGNKVPAPSKMAVIASEAERDLLRMRLSWLNDVRDRLAPLIDGSSRLTPLRSDAIGEHEDEANGVRSRGERQSYEVRSHNTNQGTVTIMGTNVSRGMATLENAVRRRIENEIRGIETARIGVESDSPEWRRLADIENSLRGVFGVLDDTQD